MTTYIVPEKSETNKKVFILRHNLGLEERITGRWGMTAAPTSKH
jgi:hypothetical protein